MLTSIQKQLAALYRLEHSFDVQAFVVPRSQMSGVPLDRPEQVLVKQEEDALELCLVLDDALLEPAESMDLERFCVCAEGVSHLLYLALAAERDSQVTQLELELQAEIDKFVLLVFATGGRPADLITRLFLEARLRDSVAPGDERDRYEEANRLALRYCRWLETRFMRHARRDELLGEVRKVYRMAGSRKIGYVNECRL